VDYTLTPCPFFKATSGRITNFWFWHKADYISTHYKCQLFRGKAEVDVRLFLQDTLADFWIYTLHRRPTLPQ
jgi:hypothetical protein